ncbi:response regulator [Brevundimonas diminuta]|uniref:Regulatory protein VirG n=1 Tax=Brevundimonas diminuta TaxID=293 RepID=A0A1Z3LW28_BREDI|nr:response regulator [Brevundimonas diminuta]ASD26207.1 DNA-binding response regulator [Brevundimonas diminuta]
MSVACIAVVEDDRPIRDLVCRLLQAEQFDVVACADGRALDALMSRRRVDLVVLDRMLPHEDGLNICRRLNQSWPETSVIMVTARGEDLDRVVGLEVGADDYLAKPFNPRELVARVRAVLRRSRPPEPRPTPRRRYRFAGWTLDASSRELNDPSGRIVELTGGEFDLLHTLITHPQRVLSRDQLLDWTRGRNATPFDRTIDVQLARLRRKLADDPRSPRIIRTVRGGGYLFAPEIALI